MWQVNEQPVVFDPTAEPVPESARSTKDWMPAEPHAYTLDEFKQFVVRLEKFGPLKVRLEAKGVVRQSTHRNWSADDPFELSEGYQPRLRESRPKPPVQVYLSCAGKTSLCLCLCGRLLGPCAVWSRKSSDVSLQGSCFCACGRIAGHACACGRKYDSGAQPCLSLIHI